MYPIPKPFSKSFFLFLVISSTISLAGYYRYFSLFYYKKPLVTKKSSRTKPTLDVEQKFYLFPGELLSEFEEMRYTIPMSEQIKKKSDVATEDISKNILKSRDQAIIQSELESFAN